MCGEGRYTYMIWKQENSVYVQGVIVTLCLLLASAVWTIFVYDSEFGLV